MICIILLHQSFHHLMLRPRRLSRPMVLLLTEELVNIEVTALRQIRWRLWPWQAMSYYLPAQVRYILSIYIAIWTNWSSIQKSWVILPYWDGSVQECSSQNLWRHLQDHEVNNKVSSHFYSILTSKLPHSLNFLYKSTINFKQDGMRFLHSWLKPKLKSLGYPFAALKLPQTTKTEYNR